jgi:hypothetical protein
MRTQLDMDKIAKGLGAKRRGKVASAGGHFVAMQLLADIDAPLPRSAGWRQAYGPGLDRAEASAAGATNPDVLSVRHWNRLLGGRLLAPAARVDWATLLQRTFQIDVLACPKCNGRLRVLGQITEPALIRLVLENVGLPMEVPQPARARDPTALLAQLDAN